MKKRLNFFTIGLFFSITSISFSKSVPKQKVSTVKALDPKIQEIGEKALLAYIKGDKFKTMKYPLEDKTYELGFIDFWMPKKKTKKSTMKLSGDKIVRDFFKEKGEEALVSYLKTLKCVDKSTSEDKKDGFLKIEFLGALPGEEKPRKPYPIVSLTLEPISEEKPVEENNINK